MILTVSIVLGLALRWLSKGSLRGLSQLKLRGEGVLLALLVLQMLLPAVGATGGAAQVVRWIWIGTFPLLILVALWNRDVPGMAVMATGLSLNFLVVALNGGMPVLAQAASVVRPGLPLGIGARDFVHIAGDASTKLLWLADVIPLPGPTWIRAIASPGDLLLVSAITALLAGAAGSEVRSQEKQEA